MQGKEQGEGDPFSLLLLPSKADKRCALTGSGSTHGRRERWDPLYLGDEKVPTLPSGVPAQIPAVPSSHLCKRGEIPERQTSSRGTLLLAICPRGYFYCYQEKIHPVQLRLSWSKSVVQARSTVITCSSLLSLSKGALPTSIHCTSPEKMEDIKRFVLAQAGGKKRSCI